MRAILFILVAGVLLSQPPPILRGVIVPSPEFGCLYYTAECNGDTIEYPTVCGVPAFYNIDVTGTGWWNFIVGFTFWCVGDSVTITMQDSCEGLQGEITGYICEGGICDFDTCYLDEDLSISEYGWDVINVYPFPFNTKEAIHTWGTSSFSVNVYDMQGRKVSSERVDDMLYWQAEKSGVYLLQPYNIETNEYLPTIKIICVD